MTGKLVKVVIEGDDWSESLWALDLGEGRYQLRNLPNSPGYNYGDIVSCRDDAGVLLVTEVLEPGPGLTLEQEIALLRFEDENTSSTDRHKLDQDRLEKLRQLYRQGNG